MRDRRKRNVVSWSALFWCTLVVVLSYVIFTSFRLFHSDAFHPELLHGRRTPLNRAVSDYSSVNFRYSVQETVTLPDQALVFLNHPPTVRPFAREDIDCVYFAMNSSIPKRRRRPIDVDDEGCLQKQIVRCPLPPRGSTVSIKVRSKAHLQGGHSHRWDSLAYEALIDRDNSTVVFVKGLNLRPERLSNASKFECVYGWDFQKVKFLLRSEVMSIAQEIARCRTPLSLLSNPNRTHDAIKVSIRVKGSGILHSVARPLLPSALESTTPHWKPHEMCICSMLRNQARFLKEWIIYHSHLGVRRWFIYDNNSNDDIEDVIASISDLKHNISRHIWPWIKTQEAGFAHCALRARNSCKWVGFIDVDEFFYVPNGLSLLDVLRNQARNATVGEIRVSCHSFGPSGLKRMPAQGVTVGYTCRKAAPERHKSIVNPEVLNSTLINVVHHFQLRNGFHYANLERAEMVINHYKYQVWEVFKEKFYRRVATYVADWQEEQNAGSKDRAPGLGTKAVKPEDWSSRFCEVNDTGLHDLVLQTLVNQRTHLLPWQEEKRQRRRRARKKRKHKGFL